MEVRAIAKFVRAQPKKLRTVAREIAGKPAAHSSALLRYHPSKSARVLRKVLDSAIANAVENHQLSAEELVIAKVSVDEGPRLKRITQRAMGRGNRILKPTAHITVVVEDEEPKARIKPHGTKAKARPKFAAPKKGKAAPAEAKKEEPVAEPAPVEEVSAEAPAAEAPTTGQPDATDAPDTANDADQK